MSADRGAERQRRSSEGRAPRQPACDRAEHRRARTHRSPACAKASAAVVVDASTADQTVTSTICTGSEPLAVIHGSTTAASAPDDSRRQQAGGQERPSTWLDRVVQRRHPHLSAPASPGTRPDVQTVPVQERRDGQPDPARRPERGALPAVGTAPRARATRRQPNAPSAGRAAASGQRAGRRSIRTSGTSATARPAGRRRRGSVRSSAPAAASVSASHPIRGSAATVRPATSAATAGLPADASRHRAASQAAVRPRRRPARLRGRASPA